VCWKLLIAIRIMKKIKSDMFVSLILLDTFARSFLHEGTDKSDVRSPFIEHSLPAIRGHSRRPQRATSRLSHSFESS